jgi:two-component system, NtrC family, response regulator AtoC
MPHALVVDDEEDAAEMMAALIAAEGFSVATAGSLRDARRQMALQSPDVVLLDLLLPDGSGMQLLDEIRTLPATEVVLITGHASVESSVQALRMGAADYLTKPLNITQLHGLLSRFRKPSSLNADAKGLQTTLESGGHFGLLWGRSAPMRKVYEQILRVAGTAVTVFVTGESGSGKELVARTVHDLSRRRGKPFLGVNCGAISPNLIESEIFGHEKGSFTGAERQHHGFFERATGGTLFLDEITEMPLDLQVKLLRVLETGTFMRVGSMQVIETDVRLVAATNRDPMQAVTAGKLREDLLYRLNVFPIHMPALRDRIEDVALIATHFLTDISNREGQKKQFSPQALARLDQYRWPGNVRELRNIVYRAYVMAHDATIVDDCLPEGAGQAAGPAPAGGDAGTDGRGAPSVAIEIGTSLAEIERIVTLATLEHYGRHKERTAAALGVSLKTLYNRLKEYATVPARAGIDADTEPSDFSELR